jgi:hypothetical protein
MPPEMNEQGIRINPNNKLSETDKAFMTINYPYFTAPAVAENVSGDAKTPLQNFQDALDIAGVSGDTRNTILDYFAQGDWQQIRYAFTDWCTSIRLVRRPARSVEPVDNGDDGELPEGFTQGCLTDSESRDRLRSSNSGSGAAHGVAAGFDSLWTPGQTVTYAFLQGATSATPYRVKRVKDALEAYAARVNLNLQEIPGHPPVVWADIRIWFGDIPKDATPGWSLIGRESVKYLRSDDAIEKRGGTADTSVCFSPQVLPADKAPPGRDARERETRVLYHELACTWFAA